MLLCKSGSFPGISEAANNNNQDEGANGVAEEANGAAEGGAEAGTNPEAAPAKKKKKKKKKNNNANANAKPVQTDPPTIAIGDLFPDGEFPEVGLNLYILQQSLLSYLSDRAWGC